MLKYILLSIIFITILKDTQCQLSFEISLDNEEDCILWQSKSDVYGNIILVGLIGTYSNSDYDAFIMKVTPEGQYTIRRFDLTDTLSLFSSIDILYNDYYLITGSYSIQGNSFERDHFWVVILDQDLNTVSQQTYLIKEPYIGYGTPACSLIDNDGNIVITAIALNEDTTIKTTFGDFVFYKLNQVGDTLLSKYYSYIFNELPYELRKIPGSNNLMLIEKSTHYNGHEELMFLDSDLNILQINQFDNEDSDISGDVSSDYWLSDTSFLLSGGGNWETTGSPEYFIGVYTVDTSAKIQNELILNKPDTADYPAWRNSMAYANDSTIYIGGFQVYMELWSVQPTVVELYMIDKNMNLLGYKQLGGDANYEVWGIIATDDDGCLVYGTKHDSPEQERDVQIWKVIRDDINIITDIYNIKAETNEILPYPNPFTDQLYIQLTNNENWDQLFLTIFTLEGKKVYQRQFTESGNILKMNLQNLKNGYYIINLEENGKIIYNKKILKK